MSATGENLTKAWLTKWKDRSDIIRSFSPVHWGYTAQHPERAYEAECPNLMQLDAVYGKGSSVYWVESMITGIFGASSSREKGQADGIRVFCEVFAAQAKRFKLSELMLFFARYKAGKYDSSYAAFDSRRIGNAFFKEFIPERNREIDNMWHKNNVVNTERNLFVPPRGYTTLSWLQEVRRRAAAGDEEAKKLLTPPPGDGR